MGKKARTDFRREIKHMDGFAILMNEKCKFNSYSERLSQTLFQPRPNEVV